MSCKTPAVDPPDAAASPQAQAEPAPLAFVPASSSAAGVAATGDAGPTPEPFRADEELAPDGVRELTPTHEANGKEGTRELAGIVLQAIMRSGEGPPAPRAPEVNVAAIEAARRKMEPRMAIEIAAGRARFIFSGGFVLPAGTELRSRVDRYGHLLFWPTEGGYRVAPPGALRALLGERRLDVAPLSPADVRTTGEGARRLNMRTRRLEITTRAAKATFEVAVLPGPVEGASLVCRFLLDLMSALPSTAACAGDEAPVHAEIRWTTRGGLSFDVTSMARRTDPASPALSTPPASAPLVIAPPPMLPSELLLPRPEIASFRSAAVDVPVPSTRDAQPPPPDSGLLLVNSSDELRVVWLDGVPIAWVAPAGRLPLATLLRGRYVLQWRTFLGDAWEPPDTVVVPGVSEVGASK